MAWHGRILRVDLTAGTATAEPLNMAWAEEYLGQRGLATKYLMEEMDPAIDPLAPENKMIFATGPLTGTMAATGGRWSVVTKGALTNTIACSNSGGQFGGELKLAGWDFVIFEGKSPKPVYLLIRDDEATLLPAEDFIWGASVWETEDRLRTRHQEPALRIASIGVAGERLVHYACVMNDRDRAAGRSGVGAVMGSKNLKAVAVRGTRGVTTNDGKAFMGAVADAREKLDPHPARARLAKVGTMAMMDVTHAYGALPTNNNREVQFAGRELVNAAAIAKPNRETGQANLVGNKACFACTIGCGRMARISPDHFTVKGGGRERYKDVMGGLEYESGFALASMVGVTDLDAATFASAICNEQGMDPISFGVTVAAAMELYDIGAITDAETGGPALTFGNAEALTWAAEITGTPSGFGIDLGLGAKRLCEKYGHPDVAMVVKGQEIPGYDGRAMQGMALAYATSSRGACHMRASPFADDFVNIRPEGKAAIIKDSQDYAAVIDCTGLCAFTKNAWQIDDYAAQVSADLPGEWSSERLMEIGERVYNLERQFNNAAGFTASDDTVPKRMLEEPAPSGAGKGRVVEMAAMLPEYYDLRGWDRDGRPTAETLGRLRLG